MIMAFKVGLSKQAILAITLLLLSLSLLLCTSFAASGGRMGGDSFSKPKQSSSSSPDLSSTTNYHYNHHYYHHRNQGYTSSTSKDDDFPTWAAVIIFCACLAAVFWAFYFHAKETESSLIMVQVGLTGKASSLQGQLNEIAKTTDTSSSKGWKLILTETVSALLQHRHYFVSGYSSVKNHGSVESLETNFRQISIEEREKMDMESLVNVNNLKRQREVLPNVSKLDKIYMVVTLLVAVKGSCKVDAIRSIDGLKSVLRSLNFASDELLAVEVLWTPQDESDTLSEDELLEDYPLLRPI